MKGQTRVTLYALSTILLMAGHKNAAKIQILRVNTAKKKKSLCLCSFYVFKPPMEIFQTEVVTSLLSGEWGVGVRGCYS